jgi:predicted DNA binding CopG/RHH family protein
MNTKYWIDYNTDTSGQGRIEFEYKSTNLEDALEEAIEDWNAEADDENKIENDQILNIKKLASEFFNKEHWISVNIIQAMISQES